MRRFKILTVIILFVASACAYASDSSSENTWSQYRGPNRDGVAADKNLHIKWEADSFKKKWNTHVGIGYSSFSFYKDFAYTMGNDKTNDTVYCINIDNGEIVWSHSYPEALDPDLYNGGPSVTPTVDEGKVYSLSKSGRLICFEAEKGKIIWQHDPKSMGAKPMRWGCSGSPLILEEKVIVSVGGNKGSNVALNKKTGKVIWRSGKHSSTHASPTLFKNKEVVLSVHGKGVQATSVKDGKTLWSHEWKSRYGLNCPSPVVKDDMIFFSSSYMMKKTSIVIQVKKDKPKLIWQSKVLISRLNTAILWDDVLFGADNSKVKCVDFKTGKLLWSMNFDKADSIIMVDGKLLVLNEKGILLVLEPSKKEAKELMRKKINRGRTWTIPAFHKNHLYIRNSTGEMICWELSRS